MENYLVKRGLVVTATSLTIIAILLSGQGRKSKTPRNSDSFRLFKNPNLDLPNSFLIRFLLFIGYASPLDRHLAKAQKIWDKIRRGERPELLTAKQRAQNEANQYTRRSLSPGS